MWSQTCSACKKHGVHLSVVACHVRCWTACACKLDYWHALITLNCLHQLLCHCHTLLDSNSSRLLSISRKTSPSPISEQNCNLSSYSLSVHALLFIRLFIYVIYSGLYCVTCFHNLLLRCNNIVLKVFVFPHPDQVQRHLSYDFQMSSFWHPSEIQQAGTNDLNMTHGVDR